MIVRRWPALPALVLSSACVPQMEPAMIPVTPSRRLAMSNPAVLARVGADATSDDLASWWELPESLPWQRFEKLTLVSALDRWQRPLPDVRDLPIVQRAAAAGATVARLCASSGTMWIVDLRGAASVAFGQAMSHACADPVGLVLTFNNWPAEAEVVPAEETLGALATMAPRALADDATSAVPVFLLDSWRLSYREQTVDPLLTDNRYMLGTQDFPPAPMLDESGIRRIVYLVDDADETTCEEDDLVELFNAYQAAGVRIILADVDELAGASTFATCEEALTRRPLELGERVTVVSDPAFYGRTHGFGHAPWIHFHFGSGG